MALEPDETRRRIIAARYLLNMSQKEMSEKGHADYGLDIHELERLERGKLKKGIQPYHLQVLTGVLQVPYAWFTEPREVIVSQGGQALLDELEASIRRIRRRPDEDAGPVGPLPGTREAEAEARGRQGRTRAQPQTRRQGR